MRKRWVQSIGALLAASAALAVGVYTAYVGVTWFRYGHAPDAEPDERDEFLDGLMPNYDVVERHQIRVAAPPAVTFAVAGEQDLFGLAPVRLIFKARELALGATPDDQQQPRGLLAAARSLGWGVLAEEPGRAIVMGAVTKPWEPNVVFHALPAREFSSFSKPGFVKIAWTLRADPVDEGGSLFRTETRAIATDPIARARFRRYWAFASPGIAMIRRLSLRPLKRDAEQRVQASLSSAEQGQYRRAAR